MIAQKLAERWEQCGNNPVRLLQEASRAGLELPWPRAS